MRSYITAIRANNARLGVWTNSTTLMACRLMDTFCRSHDASLVDQDQVAHSPSDQSELKDLGYIVR